MSPAAKNAKSVTFSWNTLTLLCQSALITVRFNFYMFVVSQVRDKTLGKFIDIATRNFFLYASLSFDTKKVLSFDHFSNILLFPILHFPLLSMAKNYDAIGKKKLLKKLRGFLFNMIRDFLSIYKLKTSVIRYKFLRKQIYAWLLCGLKFTRFYFADNLIHDIVFSWHSCLLIEEK